MIINIHVQQHIEHVWKKSLWLVIKCVKGVHRLSCPAWHFILLHTLPNGQCPTMLLSYVYTHTVYKSDYKFNWKCDQLICSSQVINHHFCYYCNAILETKLMVIKSSFEHYWGKGMYSMLNMLNMSTMSTNQWSIWLLCADVYSFTLLADLNSIVIT